MERGRPRPKLTSRILAKIVDHYVPEIHFAERDRSAIGRWLCLRIDFVNKNTHPLVPCAMCVNSTALFASGFYLYSLFSRLHGIVGINALNDEIRMTVEVAVLNKDPCMIGKAGRQHVGQDTRHDGRTKHVIQSLESFGQEMLIHVVEKIVNVLKGETKIVDPQLIGQGNVEIEASRINKVPFHHGCSQCIVPPWSRSRTAVCGTDRWLSKTTTGS